jgi:hypothetical protein
MEQEQMEIQLRVMALEIASKTPGIQNTEVIVLAKHILSFIKGEQQ